MGSIVAIVGRPNVGKSTLFNRLVERREAIVDSVSGVTRDRNYGRTDWNGREFSVIDTGGYVVGSDDVFEAQIDKQVRLAIEEADVILFMVDAHTGITPMDQDVAKILLREDKPVLLVVNKVDNLRLREEAVEFYALGLGEYYPLASASGSGTGEVLDAVVENLPDVEDKSEEDLPRFAVVGRPNAGKSSFINTLIGEERYIVTDIAGTTRDSIDTKYKRSEEHTSELQSRGHLVCRLLLEKKKKIHLEWSSDSYCSYASSSRAAEVWLGRQKESEARGWSYVNSAGTGRE